MSSPAKPQDARRVVSAAQKGLRLDQFVAESYGVSRGIARKWILAGKIALNRRIVRVASKEVFTGAVVECQAEIPDAAAPEAAPARFTAQDLQVLHWDADWMVIAKPAGLPTQPTLDPNRPTAAGLAKEWLALKTGKPAYLALHHRLDRDTSGVLVFATGKQANVGLARAFKERLARKTYWAWVAGRPDWKDSKLRVENFLHVIKMPGKKNRVRSVRAGGDHAVTEFECLETRTASNGETVSLICARPLTGRMHQIRVHLAEAGVSILGDPTYGGKTHWAGQDWKRVALHALRLELPHPVSNEPTTWEAAVPQDLLQAWGRLPHATGGPGRNQTV